MRATLLGTPIADFRTKFANLAGVLTAASHHAYAQFANVRAFDAALWAVVGTLIASHFVQTVLAINDTFLTGFNTGLMFRHLSFSK